MKMIARILIVMIIALGVITIVPQNVVRAAGEEEIIGQINPGDVQDPGEATNKLTTLAANVLKFLQIASAIAAVIMIAVTGFRYIIESPEVKAELKKNMLPIIIGIVLVFFATSIARFFIGIFSNNQG